MCTSNSTCIGMIMSVVIVKCCNISYMCNNMYLRCISSGCLTCLQPEIATCVPLSTATWVTHLEVSQLPRFLRTVGELYLAMHFCLPHKDIKMDMFMKFILELPAPPGMPATTKDCYYKQPSNLHDNPQNNPSFVH